MNIYLDMFLTFAKIGTFTFGGGYAMLPMLQRELSDKKHWATNDEILDCYAIGQCTPGVIAVNTSTFVGFKQKGIPGAIVSTLGMVVPSIIIITVVATVLGNFSSVPAVQNALSGIRVAVCGLLTVTLYKLLRQNVKDIIGALLVLLSFVCTVFFGVPAIYIVLSSAAIGIVICSIRKHTGKRGDSDKK